MIKKLLVGLLFLFFSMRIYAQNEIKEFGNITISDLKETHYSADSTVHAAYLFKEEFLKFMYTKTGWIFIKEVHERVKIYDAKGYYLALKKVPFYKLSNGQKEKVVITKASTFTLENETIVESKLSKKEVFEEDKSEHWKQKKFTMPNVQDGAILEWKYKIKSPFVTYIDRFKIQEEIPVKSYFSFLAIPEYFNFKIYKRGIIPIEVKKIVREMSGLRGKQNMFLFELENIPAFREEPYILNNKDYMSSIDFDLKYVQFPNSSKKYLSSDTWEDVAKGIFKRSSYGVNLKKKKYFEDDLLALGLEGKSDKEKVKLIFEYLKSRIVWNKKYGTRIGKGVKKAYEIGEGNVVDVNLVLIAMLKASGLNASPVLISTREHGVALFPSDKGYNYIITAVESIEENPILLDPTEKYSALNVLPFRDLNWQGRLIREDLTSKEVKLTPKYYAYDSKVLNVSIDENLKIKGFLKTMLTHQSALTRRNEVLGLEEDALKENIEKKYKIAVDNFREAAKEDTSRPYVNYISFSSKEWMEVIGGKVYFNPLLFLKMETNPFKLKERKYPVDFGQPWKEEYSVSIKVPNDYKVSYLPQSSSFKMSKGIGGFTYHLSNEDNTIKVKFIQKFDIEIIHPKYYEELKKMYKEIISKQNQKIVLIKK